SSAAGNSYTRRRAGRSGERPAAGQSPKGGGGLYHFSGRVCWLYVGGGLLVASKSERRTGDECAVSTSEKTPTQTRRRAWPPRVTGQVRQLSPAHVASSHSRRDSRRRCPGGAMSCWLSSW